MYSLREYVLMNTRREATTQAKFDAILNAKDIAIVRAGYWRARESSHVEAWGSSHVEAWDSSHVEARESSHVEAWGSSHVEAWDSSHVEARGSSHVEAWESSLVEATKYVSCVIGDDHRGKVTGGVQIRPDYSTVEKWLKYHGVKVSRGECVLYKAVRDDFKSARGFLYQPGTKVEAPDWDGDARECGGGLHLSPCFEMARDFDSEATKSLACTVAVKDLAIGPMPLQYPQKIKARRILKIEEVKA
jgi:hypothetical protein